MAEFEDGPFKASWTLDDVDQPTTITFEITAQTDGYVAIGFGDGNRFHSGGTDAVMSAVSNGVGSLSDVSSNGQNIRLDDESGDYQLIASSEVDGVTSVTIVKQVNPENGGNYQLIDANQEVNVFWAIGNNDNIQGQHGGGQGNRNFFTAQLLNPNGSVSGAGFELDPALGLFLSVILPLFLFSLYKLCTDYDKGTLRQYTVAERAPAGRAMKAIQRVSNKISASLKRGQTLPVSSPGSPGSRPDSFSNRMSMALTTVREKIVTVNYSPKSLNNQSCSYRLKQFLKRRVSGEMTVLHLTMIILFSGIAGFWIFFEDFTGFRAADAFGYVCCSAALLTVIPATRNSIMTFFLSTPFERSVVYHRYLGTFTFIAGAAHTILYLIEWQDQGVLEINVQVDKYQQGFIAMGGLTIVFLTALSVVRRSAYTFFRNAHYFFFVFFIAGCFHTEVFIIYAVVAGLLYGFDIFMRYALGITPKQAFAVDVLPGDVTRIKFPKSPYKKYASGQYVFINVPAVSSSEWHPFTLSSGPNQDYLEVHVKALGDFTTKLLNEAVLMGEKGLPKLRVDGPYGRIAFNYKRYENILLVGGGVGVTPMISVLKDLFQIDMSEEARRRNPISPYVKNVYFLWVVPTVAPWSWFFETLKVAMDTSLKGSAAGFPKLRVKGYCTKPDPSLSGLQKATRNIPNYKINEGRPDVVSVMDGVESSIGVGAKRTAVLACGPTQLVSSVWDECIRRTRPGISFDVHREEFNF